MKNSLPAVRLGLAAGLSVLTAAPAFAGSAAQPGQTIGLPVGAQLPIGLYFVDTSSFGLRGTLPRDSESNINLPAFAWATPWTLLDARLQCLRHPARRGLQRAARILSERHRPDPARPRAPSIPTIATST